MPKVEVYYRPETVEEALRLLARPSTRVLAGGTQLVARLPEPTEVVDLQAVGLNQIEVADDTITLGAMVRLQEMVDHADMPQLVRDMARREGPNTFRHMGTIGGTVATADPESELYAALLVHEATVTMQTQTDTHTVPLADFSLPPQTLITAVTLQRGGETAAARVARTPADKPIVAVIGRRVGEDVRLAGCGVAARPLLLTPDALDTLTPPSDFRGSSEYRREMIDVLVRRVVEQLDNKQSTVNK